MSALTLEIVARDGAVAELAHRALGGHFAGALVPAHVVVDAAAEAKEPLEVEAIVPEVLATRFAGDSAAARVAAAARQGPVLAWCAAIASLPRPGGGALSGAWLRFAIGLGSGRERLAPLVTLRIRDQRLVIRFGMGGAPVLAPPPRDRGGPIDQAWAAAAREARAAMGRALARLREAERVDVSVVGEGVALAELEALGREWQVPVSASDAGLGAVAMPSVAPGPCRACRHANQGTEDLVREQLLACALAGPRPHHLDPVCDVVWSLEGKKWFAFEPYDGGNSTWGLDGELRVKLPGKPPARRT